MAQLFNGKNQIYPKAQGKAYIMCGVRLIWRPLHFSSRGFGRLLQLRCVRTQTACREERDVKTNDTKVTNDSVRSMRRQKGSWRRTMTCKDTTCVSDCAVSRSSGERPGRMLDTVHLRQRAETWHLFQGSSLTQICNQRTPPLR